MAEDFELAKADWEREVEVLTLLARGRKIVQLGGQYHNVKWVTRIREKAMNYPVLVLKQLPAEIQDYIVGITKNNRPMLKAELFHSKELREHYDGMSNVAKNLSDNLREMRAGVHDMNATIEEMTVENNKREFLLFLEGYDGKCLLTHTKAELPQLKNLNAWHDLRIREISNELLDKLVQRAIDRKYKYATDCPACESLTSVE